MPRVEPQLLTYEGRSYAATFKHRQFYSKFVGSAWFEFSDDYGLRAGDRIVFTLDHLTFDLKIETYRGGQRLLPVPTVAFENLSDSDYWYTVSAVQPPNLDFNFHEMSHMVRCLFREDFLRCRPIVHVMTPTNIVKHIMKIPKDVISRLKHHVEIPSSTLVTLECMNDNLHVIIPSSFSMCKKDGRMVIDKITFEDFITASCLQAGNVVLITFKEHKDRSVSIVFQLLK